MASDHDLSEKLAALWRTAGELGREAAAGPHGVEGRRFLLRMLAASVDTYVENADADRPRFEHAESATRKMFADCPDTDYLRAPLRVGGGRAYRLRGRIPNGTLYVGVLLYGKGGRIGNRLTDADLALDEEGSFEVRIAVEEQAGTWLRADGDETAVIVRQYFGDRAKEAPIDVGIEYLGEPAPPAALSAAELAAGVARAESMLRAIFERTKFAQQLATTAAADAFIVIPGEQFFPTPDNTYAAAWYRMGEARRVVVRGRVPKARYFSVTLYNAWLESFDYRRHRISLNHTRLQTAADGSFEIVLAHEDPGTPNWLDTAGHDEGCVLVRVLLLEGEMPGFELSAP